MPGLRPPEQNAPDPTSFGLHEDIFGDTHDCASQNRSFVNKNTHLRPTFLVEKQGGKNRKLKH